MSPRRRAISAAVASNPAMSASASARRAEQVADPAEHARGRRRASVGLTLSTCGAPGNVAADPPNRRLVDRADVALLLGQDQVGAQPGQRLGVELVEAPVLRGDQPSISALEARSGCGCGSGAGSRSTPGGKSHSWVTPTRSSPRPRAQTSSVKRREQADDPHGSGLSAVRCGGRCSGGERITPGDPASQSKPGFVLGSLGSPVLPDMLLGTVLRFLTEFYGNAVPAGVSFMGVEARMTAVSGDIAAGPRDVGSFTRRSSWDSGSPGD